MEESILKLEAIRTRQKIANGESVKLVITVAVSLTIVLGKADVCSRLCKYWNSTF